MTKLQRENRISKIINESCIFSFDPKFSDTPTVKELYKYSKICLRKKRMKKKFDKNYYRYVKERVFLAYIGKVMVVPIRRCLNYDSIGRKLFMIEELPQKGI